MCMLPTAGWRPVDAFAAPALGILRAARVQGLLEPPPNRGSSLVPAKRIRLRNVSASVELRANLGEEAHPGLLEEPCVELRSTIRGTLRAGDPRVSLEAAERFRERRR